MEPIGEKIRRIRKSKGISQNIVADECRIKQSSYANIESGKTQNITIEIGRGIAKALGVSFAELFEIEVSGSTKIEQESQIQKLQDEITELKKRIEEKDDLIKLLKNENDYLNFRMAWDNIEIIFDLLIEDELKIRNANTEEEKSISTVTYDLRLRDLKSEIDKSIEAGYILFHKLFDLFFDSNEFCELIENESKDKNEFIKNSTEYINRFYQVKEKDIEDMVNTSVVTKWDSDKKRKKKRIRSY